MSQRTDTLTFNQALIEKWKDQGINYERDLQLKKKKETKEVKDDRSLNINKSYNNFSMTMSIVLAIALIVGLIIYFSKNFADAQKVEVDLTDEDTIYGIDFEKVIREMESQGNYFQCIRMKYLQLLRQLHDEKYIFWTIAKTPTQYTYELKILEFKMLTNIFMKIRYGNYPATQDLYNEFCQLCQVLNSKKGGME